MSDMSQHFAWEYFQLFVGQNCGTIDVDKNRIRIQNKYMRT